MYRCVSVVPTQFLWGRAFCITVIGMKITLAISPFDDGPDNGGGDDDDHDGDGNELENGWRPRHWGSGVAVALFALFYGGKGEKIA